MYKQQLTEKIITRYREKPSDRKISTVNLIKEMSENWEIYRKNKNGCQKKNKMDLFENKWLTVKKESNLECFSWCREDDFEFYG